MPLFRIGTMIFFILGSMTIIIRALAPLTKGLNAGLPYKTWVPYSLENRLFFWLTYFLQALGSFGIGEATIAIDTFIMVMMLQICAQLEILMYRIQKQFRLCANQQHPYSIEEQNVLGIWIQHHESIYM